MPREKNTKSLDRPELPPKPDILREKYGRSLEKADFGKERAARSLDRPELPPKEKQSKSLDRAEPREKPTRMEKRIEEMCRQERASWTNDKTSWSMDRRMEEASRMEKERSFVEKSDRATRSADRRVKHRHRSLGDVPKSPLPPEPLPSKKKSRITEHSRQVFFFFSFSFSTNYIFFFASSSKCNYFSMYSSFHTSSNPKHPSHVQKAS